MQALDVVSPPNPHLNRDLALESIARLDAVWQQGRVIDPMDWAEQRAIIVPSLRVVGRYAACPDGA